MRIQAASVDQIRQGVDGRMHAVSADVGGIAEELERIDPGLGVRFAEAANPPYWHVFYACCPTHKRHDPACQECREGRSTYLVTSVQAVQNRSGTWEGLDRRLVDRLMMIRPEAGYDYAAELVKHDEAVRRAHRHRFHEHTGEAGEVAAHALRKAQGARYKGRAFVPRDLSA